MPYKEQIILFTGGLNDYIGELDQRTHKMGAGWYRILNPCHHFSREVVKAVAGKSHTVVEMMINRMAGPPGRKEFKNYVDIYIPEGVQLEIKTLDKSGSLYKTYNEQLNKKPGKIIVPEFGGVVGKA